MRISELSRRSGASIATIKYYIRERLLPPGTPTATNQALYGEEHLRDLDLIRALREQAGLSIAAIRRVLESIAAAESDREDMLAAGIHSMHVERHSGEHEDTLDREAPEYRQSWEELRRLLAARGWKSSEDDLEIQELLRAMSRIRGLWPSDLPEGVWEAYAELGQRAARFEIPDSWDPDRFPLEMLRFAIVGTFLFEPVILSFRRIALAERHRQLRAERQRERHESPDEPSTEQP